MKKTRVKIAVIAVLVVILGVVGILSRRDRKVMEYVNDDPVQQGTVE